MNKLDDAIREALSREDAEFLAKFQNEPSPPAEIGDLFVGPRAGYNVFFLAIAAIFGIVFVYSGWRFAMAEELRALAHWGGLCAFALAVLTVIRLWFFMDLHASRVIREVKRLELQVARLAERTSV